MKIKYIIAAILTLTLALYSCKEDGPEQMIIPAQRVAFEKHLSGETYEGYWEQDKVYVFVVNRDRPEYPTATEAEKGDTVSFFFEACVFASGSKYGMGGIFYTNKEEVMEKIKDLDHEYWDKNIREIKVGESALIKGLGRGIPGCKEGDSLLLYITSDLSYKEYVFAGLPPNTPQVWALNIKKVRKK